jgi:hypothetical protein
MAHVPPMQQTSGAGPAAPAPMGETLGVGGPERLALRQHALGLMEQGQWREAVAVVRGLLAMGDLHPADPLLLARCFTGMGQPQAAQRAVEHARQIHAALGLTFPEELAQEVAPCR